MIRSIKSCEIEKCVEVIKKSFLTVAQEYGFTEENAPRFTAFSTTAERLNWQYEESRPMYGYFDERGQILGYYSLQIQENEECELNNLCVLPEYRHKNIGERLFSHALMTAVDRGCKKMNIGIVEENKKLRAWYEKLGAKHIGTKKFDFFPFTCGYMEKNVTEGKSMVDITSMTTMCADVFDATGEIFPGGEALNFAAVACEYPHIHVGIVGAIGDDECGKAVLNSIQGKAIDKSAIHIIESGITASNRIYLTPAGDRYFKDDSWNSGVYGDFRMSEEDIEVLKRSDIVFINYYSPNFAEVLELRKRSSFKLAVDFDEVRDFDTLEKIVPYTDFFFISGEEGILPVFQNWSEKYDGLFNATLAENGSVTFHRGMEYRVEAVPVAEVVDTTGCGDSYHAAFVCSYAKDNDIISAMNEGSEVAAKTLAHIGGF